MTKRVEACGIYARISQDDGTAFGVTRQVDDCTKEAARRGWPIEREFVDNDVSATRAKKRPEYDALLAAIEDGTIDAVVVYDIDRLTRTPSELEHFISLADRHHIALASVGGHIDLATPQGRLTARIKGDVARHEVEQMSRRLKRKFEENAKEGKPHGVTPFGYRRERVVDDRGRDIGYREVIDEAEAAAIRRLYEMLIGGHSLRSLAKHLNDLGLRTGRGNAFQGNVVGNMLRRPRYAGHRTHGKEIIGKGAWEPIVSQDTYDQALAVLTSPGRRIAHGLEPKHLLSGIALCGRCGTAMRPLISSKRQPCYACPGCMKVTRKMEPVHQIVEQVMIARLTRPDALEAMAGKPDALRGALAARDAVLARMDTAADSFAEGLVTARQLARINDQLKVQLGAAEREVMRSQPLRILDGMTGAGAGDNWKTTPVERQRAVVRALATVTILPSGPGIRFSPDQVRIDWKAHQ